MIGVSDTGKGLDREEMAKLFARFSQANPQTDQYGGAGLGLYISRELVGLQNGFMEVESKKGLGSTFRFGRCFRDIGSTFVWKDKWTELKCFFGQAFPWRERLNPSTRLRFLSVQGHRLHHSRFVNDPRPRIRSLEPLLSTIPKHPLQCHSQLHPLKIRFNPWSLRGVRMLLKTRSNPSRVLARYLFMFSLLKIT